MHAGYCIGTTCATTAITTAAAPDVHATALPQPATHSSTLTTSVEAGAATASPGATTSPGPTAAAPMARRAYRITSGTGSAGPSSGRTGSTVVLAVLWCWHCRPRAALLAAQWCWQQCRPSHTLLLVVPVNPLAADQQRHQPITAGTSRCPLMALSVRISRHPCGEQWLAVNVSSSPSTGP